MAIAETAQLSVLLTLKDQLSAGLARAEAELAGLNRVASTTTPAVGRVGGALTSAKGAALGFGTALGTARKSIGGLISGPLGLLGLGAGLYTVSGFLTGSINKAQEFTKASADLASALHLPIGAASALVDTMDDFGISADKQLVLFGRLEKNAEVLAGDLKKAAAFQKEYGFSLTDNNGKVLDANGLLQKSADYWKSNATSSEKALVMSKLWGKTWTTLIPLFNLGGKGIKDYTDEQIHLTAAQVKSAAEFRNQQRLFQSTFDELQTMIGIEFFPDLAGILKGLTKGISENKGEILGFFKGMLSLAKEIGGAVNTFIVPAVKGIAGAWNAIPPDLRKLLITGLIANKALKVVFGFDPLKIVGGGIADLAKGLFGRGSSPASPMFTKEVGIGGAGGAGGGLAGKLGTGLAVAGAGLAVFGVIETWMGENNRNSEISLGLQGQTNKWLSAAPSKAELQNGLAGVQEGIDGIRSNPLNVLVQGDALNKLEAMKASIQAQIAEIDSLKPYLVSIAEAAANGQQTINYLAGERTAASIASGPSTHRGPVVKTPRTGIEKNRTTIIQVKATSSGRQNQSAQSMTTAYGPTPISAGGAVVLVD